MENKSETEEKLKMGIANTGREFKTEGKKNDTDNETLKHADMGKCVCEQLQTETSLIPN